jgi:uncharacterized repeat protein (TIGR01451 family)
MIGDYTLTGIGTGDGPYTITIRRGSEGGGETARTVVNGTAVTGSTIPPITTTIDDGTAPPTPADLAVALSDAPDPVVAGQQVTFTMNVTNAGPGAASNVVATMTLPASLVPESAPQCVLASPITCNIGALAAGAGTTLTVAVTASQAGTVSTTASVTATESDPSLVDNSDTESTAVKPLDTTGPRIISAAPSGTVAGPVDRFTLTFNEAVAADTFSPADVMGLTGPGGAIAVGGVTPLSPTQFEVRFAAQAGAGAYTVVVGPDIHDLAGNPMDQNQNGTNGEVPGDRFTASVTVQAPPVRRCDADLDADVDATDLLLIRAANGQIAQPGDGRDGNGDGRINVSDYRYCSLRLTVK